MSHESGVLLLLQQQHGLEQTIDLDFQQLVQLVNSRLYLDITNVKVCESDVERADE